MDSFQESWYSQDFVAERGRTVKYQRKMRGGFEQTYLVFTGSDKDITAEEIESYWPARYLVQNVHNFVGVPEQPGPAIVHERKLVSGMSILDFYRFQNSRLIGQLSSEEIDWVMGDTEFWRLMTRLSGVATADAVDRLVGDLAEMSVAQVQGFQDTLALKLFLLDHPDNTVRMGEFVSPDESLYLRCAIIVAGKGVFEKVLTEPGSVTATDLPEYYLAESLLSVAGQAVDDKADLVDVFTYETGHNGRLWGIADYIGSRYQNYPHRHQIISNDANLQWNQCPSGLVRDWPTSAGLGEANIHFGARFYLKDSMEYHEIIVWLFGSKLQLQDTEQQVRDFGKALAKTRNVEFVDFVELYPGAINYISPEIVFQVRERQLFE